MNCLYWVLTDPYHASEEAESALTFQEYSCRRSREKDHKGIRRKEGMGRVPQSQEL
jgi:hypothetical protein